MNKEFIPYEQALELKELGFNEPCFYPFTNFSDLEWSKVDSCYADFKNWNDKRYGVVSAPLYQQAFRWFRKKYNLNGILNHYPNTKLWDFSVHDLTWSGKEFIEHVKKEDRSVKYSTYEEAELACLKKLIEIVKQHKKD
jgi:hypothetical protein